MKRKNHLLTLIALLSAFLLLSCEAARNKNNILNEISGVWQDEANTMITISVIGEEKYVNLGSYQLTAEIKDIDLENNIIVLNLTNNTNGKEGICTIRQLWDEDEETFTITFTLDGQKTYELDFLRNL